MEKKKILLLTIGNIDHPSSRIRGIQYIPLLEKDGYEVEWIPRIPEKGKSILDKLLFPIRKRLFAFKRFFRIYSITDQIVIIQKIFIFPLLLNRLRKNNNRIIFDFDDAIYINPKDENAEIKTQKHIKSAHHIIVANEHLTSYAKLHNSQVTVITTPVDTEVLKPLTDKQVQSEFVIGWIGSFWTTKYLKIVEKVLAELSKDYPIKLKLIGADRNYTPREIPTEHISWSLQTEKEVLPSFDLGIMPLSDDEYAKGKGGYKLLQYMAAGLPAIASPVGINREIIQENETGFLAQSEEEWKKNILYLIQNQNICRNFGQRSREICEQKYSRIVCFEKYKSVLDSL